MKRLVLLPRAAALLSAALVSAGLASAGLLSAGTAQAASTGCWATVGLSSLPKPGHEAGRPWLVTVRVLQHGRTPLAEAKPEIRIRKAAGGKVTAFRARPAAAVGSYSFRVVFPAAGRWRFTVYDGFVPNCASEHSFAAVTIAPADLAP